MIHFVNPYTPGAGRMPGYLAGREDTIREAKEYMISTKAGYPQRSIVYYGLRGVGKTVLLNAIEECAEEENIMYAHIEVKEVSNLIQAISVASKKFILSISPKEAVMDKRDKVIAIFKSFSATWNPSDQTISFGVSGDSNIGAAGTGDLANDLTELLVALGKYAKQTESPICFFVDEIQYAKDIELEALITSIHRINQLGLPIIFYCAGLPKILKTMGEVKSYSERLFSFIQIDSLSKVDAVEDAISIKNQSIKETCHR